MEKSNGFTHRVALQKLSTVFLRNRISKNLPLVSEWLSKNEGVNTLLFAKHES